jgi:nitroreductase
VQGILSLQPFQRGLWFLNFVAVIVDNWESKRKNCFFCRMIGVARRRFSENLNAMTDTKLKLPQLGRGRSGLDVFDAIKERRSIRAYTDEKVSEEDVERLIDAARWAPSAGNIQPWEFVIVKDMETKRKLSDAALNQAFIEKAPVVIVVCADLNRSSRGYGSRGVHLYSLQDTAAATENILLAAQELGLATCWVGAFHESEVAKAVKAPRNLRPVAIVAVGHPAERPMGSPRRSVDEIVHYETF